MKLDAMAAAATSPRRVDIPNCDALSKATVTHLKIIRVQELCESRGGRPVLSVMSLTVSECGRKAAAKLNKPQINFTADWLSH